MFISVVYGHFFFRIYWIVSWVINQLSRPRTEVIAQITIKSRGKFPSRTLIIRLNISDEHAVTTNRAVQLNPP